MLGKHVRRDQVVDAFEVIVLTLMRKRRKRFHLCCWRSDLSQGIVKILRGLLCLSVKNWDSDQDFMSI